jgi:hypothetical protein
MVRFEKQKYQFGSILEGLAMEVVGIFYVPLVHFTAILVQIIAYGIFYRHLVYFMAVWYIIG